MFEYNGIFRRQTCFGPCYIECKNGWNIALKTHPVGFNEGDKVIVKTITNEDGEVIAYDMDHER